MKKMLFLLFSAFFIIQYVSAINVQLDQLSQNEVLVVGVDRPAVFEFNVTNYGSNARVEFYNLLGFRMLPTGGTPISSGESKIVKLEVSPIGQFDYLGIYSFPYYVRDLNDDSEVQKVLTLRRVTIDEAFETGAGEFDPQSNSVDIYLKNKYNFDFGNVKVKFASSFFTLDKEFTLGAYERKNISIQLNKDDFKQLLAGTYTLNAEVNAQGQTAKISGDMKFIEKDIVKTYESQSGFIMRTNTIKKVNEGNVLATEHMNISKNIISRLFTSFSPEPDTVDRNGFVVKYSWVRELNPGESFDVAVKTNWLFPLLLVVLIIAIVIIAKQFTSSNLVLTKKINFVRAKGGEFALKVSIVANAKRHVDGVNIIDRLPPLVTLYEKFGTERPSKVDTKMRRIEWSFPSLEAGETRVISYIIYSKVGIMGKFSLPPTTAVFEKNGQLHETESNRAFFVAEPRSLKDFKDEY